MIEGLCVGYVAFIQHTSQIQKILRTKKHLYFRQLVRPTLYYIWTMHKFLHPQTLNNKHYLDTALSHLSSPISSYEKNFVSYANVPVFYHTLFDCHLYGSAGQIIEANYFQKTSYDWFCAKLKDLQNPSFIHKRIREIEAAF